MRPTTDPLAAYADAVRSGDSRLADLIAQRLFPWARRAVGHDQAPPAARRTLERLLRILGL